MLNETSSELKLNTLLKKPPKNRNPVYSAHFSILKIDKIFTF